MISKTEKQTDISKPLGAYLVEAGIIAPEQLEIALKNQSQSGKRLGTIVVECGWIKQQTVEYLMENVVLPRRSANQFPKFQPTGDINLTLVEQRNNDSQIVSLPNSTLNFSLSPEKTTRFLVVLVSSLVICSIFFQFCVYFLPDYPLRDTFALLFNVNTEKNIPTFYSWLALLFCATLLAVIARVKKSVGDRYVNYWRMLAVIFAYLALDEALSIHEKSEALVKTSFNPSGLLYYAWVIPGAIFAIAIFLGFLKFINALPPKTKHLILTAGIVFVGGALGMESLSGAYADFYTGTNFTAAIIGSIEELMEMIGIVIFIYALLSYIRSEMNGLNVKIKIGDRQKYRHSS